MYMLVRALAVEWAKQGSNTDTWTVGVCGPGQVTRNFSYQYK